MTPYRHIITTENAWTNRSIGGKAGLTHRLSAAQLAAFDRLLAHTRHLQPQDVTRVDFDHPEMTALAAWLDRTIRHGRGVVLLSGLSRATHSESGMERIYLGIGTHLGDVAVQSMLGEQLAHVRYVNDDPVARGYWSQEESAPHIDFYRVVGLMCLQLAKNGGLSTIVSSAAIHNEILATWPDLLTPLFKGYYSAIAEAQFSDTPVMDCKIPVFCCLDDIVSCGYVRPFMERAAELRGEKLSARSVGALDYFDMLSTREDL